MYMSDSISPFKVFLDGVGEINIDWMRREKCKTVEISGKRYYEDELAEALSTLKEAEV